MIDSISTIETSRIEVNPNNPRTRIDDVSDLVASIKENGLMQPITVRWTHKNDKNGIPTGYEVIAGSRRLTACKQLGIEKMPCIIKTCDDAKAFELATTENLVRENMTAVDEAVAVKKLFDEGKSRIEVAAIFGKSAKWAEGRKRIASLGDKALKYLAEGKITLGHAEVLSLCDEENVEKWLDTAKWKKPEELKRDILNRERKLLSNSPFNWRKDCAHCPKRSDCQRDLFDDVEDVYCLDSDCYATMITKECARAEKEFKKAGYEAVSDEDLNAAKFHYAGWVAADTEREDEKEAIAKLKEAGFKPKFWIDTDTAQRGLSYNERWIESEADEDDSEEENDNVPECLKDLDYGDQEEVEDIAEQMEKDDLRKAVAEFVDTHFGSQNEQFTIDMANFLCMREEWFESTSETIENNNNQETAVQVITDHIVDSLWYKQHDGSYDDEPGFSNLIIERFAGRLKKREEYLPEAKERWQAQKDAEPEAAEEEVEINADGDEADEE